MRLVSGSPRRRILHSAAMLFAASGYSGASTRQIANRAHVNETTIYRVFKSKRQLYVKVLESKLEATDPDRLVRTLRSTDHDRGTFDTVAKLLWREFDPEFVRLLLFGALQQPRLLKECMQPRLANLLETLQEYMRGQVGVGTLKQADPVLMVHALVAMLFYHRVFNDLIGKQSLRRFDGERPEELYLDIWLNGVSVKLPAGSQQAEDAGATDRAAKKRGATGVEATPTRWRGTTKAQKER